MQETLDFLGVIDKKIKSSRNTSRTLHLVKEKNIYKRNNRYPYAKAVDFSSAKYIDYPRWLTEKEGFSDFMYKSYQKKLMSIPQICEKVVRASDQKYFISLFLQQIDIFKNLPAVVTDIILTHIKTRYFKVGELIHDEQQEMSFMAVIYAGAVQYKNGKRVLLKQKNDVILESAFYGTKHETIICKQQTILLTLDKSIYHLITSKLREQISVKQRDQISDLMKSKFFIQLHIKDKKAQNFYEDFQLQFYFKGQVIVQAGTEVNRFYMLFKGELVEQNHIYIRDHNKWPLPNRKWQVRAVYNSFHKNNILKQYNFFGDEQILSNSKLKSKYASVEWSIIFTMQKNKFLRNLSNEDIKRLKKYRAENVEVNYTQFEDSIREKIKSVSERKKIAIKAINTSLAHKSQFTTRRMNLINSFQKSMLRKTFFQQAQN